MEELIKQIQPEHCEMFLQIAENKMIPKDDGLKMKKRLHLFSDEDVFRVSADCLKPGFFFLFTSGFRFYLYVCINPCRLSR